MNHILTLTAAALLATSTATVAQENTPMIDGFHVDLGAGFRLDATGLERARKGEVMLAIVEDNLETDVPKGENAGRLLRHAGVVRVLLEVGHTRRGEAGWSGEATVAFEEGWDRENLRAVAFVQEAGSRAVVAIGVQPLTE